MRYGEIATAFLYIVYEETPVKEALKAFLKNDLHYCPVFDANQKMKGILSEAGLLKALSTPAFFNKAMVKQILDDDYQIVQGRDVVVPDSVSRYILVEKDGVLKGGITREAVLMCYNLLSTQEELKSILDSTHNGIMAIDYQGKIKIFNNSAKKVTGISEDVIGNYINEVVPSSELMAVIRTGKAIYGQRQVINGKVVITNRTPIVKDNKIVGAVGVFQDISDYEAVSKELETIMDYAFDLITITDGNGVALRANSHLEKMFGIKMNEFVGKKVVQLEAEGVVSKSVTSLVLQTKKKQTLIQDTMGGRRLAVTGVPIIDSGGNIYRVFNISRDITELSRLKSQLEETEELFKSYRYELNELRQEKTQWGNLVVRSPKMQNVMDLSKRVAGVDSTILITGESGVGKEVLARAIHDMSQRKSGPFIKINCGVIPETLLESELFGYKKGAFTGAWKEGKQGLASLADKGTLFLDEIGDLPMVLQVKVLQLIQEKTFYPVGSSTPVKVDTRIITATNRDLLQMVEKGLFREDLYYRLNVIPIVIPPLRERKAEIPILINHFLQKFGELYLRKKSISPEALEKLLQYKWPGNVRELQNIIERLVVTTEGEVIQPQHLPFMIQKEEAVDVQGTVKISTLMPIQEAVEKLEEELLRKAIHQYSRTHLVAKALGVHRSTVVRKINKYLRNDAKAEKILKDEGLDMCFPDSTKNL